MGNKSLIWIWGAGSLLCVISGFRDHNTLWFLTAGLCAWNAISWYRKYYK